MSEMFGIDISGIIADNIGPGVFDVTVTRYIEGARTPGNLTGGKARPPSTFTGIKGWWEDFTTTPPGLEIRLGDRKACLLGDTIPTGGIPGKDDAITCEGRTLYVRQLVSRDPASALYVFVCNDRKGPDGA